MSVEAANICEETTITTGTGAYTTSGVAAAGRRTFESVIDHGAFVPIFVTDGTSWEYGLYVYTSANLFTRTLIWDSSNGGAAVNWTSGTRKIYCTQIGEFTDLINRRHNLNFGGPDPTNTDDSSEGYFPGSLWRTSTAFWLCIDSSTSAAVWYKIQMSAGFSIDRTFTAGGTTGAQTINKASGSVNFAAAAATLVVTNSLVTTSSIVLAQVHGTDATMTSVRVTTASGSFTLTANAAATAETRVSFVVFN